MVMSLLQQPYLGLAEKLKVGSDDLREVTCL